MDFNFGVSSESVVRSTRRPLAPWNIYDVKFKGIELRSFQGKKDPTATYNVFDIKFENEDGYFTKTLYYPKDGDSKRRKYKRSNGSDGWFPSNFESLMGIVHQTILVLCGEEDYNKFRTLCGKVKDFNQFLDIVIKITNKKKETETKIKLIGKNRDGKVYADIPNVVAINPNVEHVAEDSNDDTGERFISDNYIGSKLFFNNWEEGEREKYLKAKPTEMKSEETIVDTAGVDKPAENDDFDLESLL